MPRKNLKEFIQSGNFDEALSLVNNEKSTENLAAALAMARIMNEEVVESIAEKNQKLNQELAEAEDGLKQIKENLEKNKSNLKPPEILKIENQIQAKEAEILEIRNKITANEEPLVKLVALDTALSKRLKEIREENQVQSLQQSVRSTVSKMLDFREKSGSGLQEAMYLQEKDQDLKKGYKNAREGAARRDRESFNSSYNALEAQVRENRDKTWEHIHKKWIRVEKGVKKKGVRGLLQILGLAAVGVTSGGIGVGAAFLSAGVAAAVAAGYEAWANKYYQLLDSEKFSASHTILIEAQQNELRRLKIKRDHAISNNDEKSVKELNKLIKKTELDLVEAKEAKEAVDKAAVEVFIKMTVLKNSSNRNERNQANKFFRRFEQDTNKLKGASEKAFQEFRINTKEIFKNAQAKSQSALITLNAKQPWDNLTEKEYSDLMYKALEAEGAAYDVTSLLTESYNRMLELQNRSEFYLKLAQNLKEKAENLEEGSVAIANQRRQWKEWREKIRDAADARGISLKEAGTSAVLGAAAYESGQALFSDITPMLNIIEEASTKGIAQILHTQAFQQKALALALVAAQETGSRAVVPTLTGIAVVQESLTTAYGFLKEHISDTLLEGIPAAHLIQDISPAGAITMCALLIYTGAHNHWYSKQLEKQFLSIQQFLRDPNDNTEGATPKLRDISELSDSELKALQAMLEKTIDDFPNLLPNTMQDDLVTAKELYEKRLARTDFLEGLTRFEGFVINDQNWRKQLGGPDKNKDAKFEKNKIYIGESPANTNNLLAYYHDGSKWCFIEKSKEDFNRYMEDFGIRASAVEFGKNQPPEKIDKVREFFGCARKPSPEETIELARSKEKIDELDNNLRSQRAAKQMAYCLTGLYRGVTNQIVTKNSLETRDRLFELSRQRELIEILEDPAVGISPSEYAEAMPLVQKYLSERKKIIDMLGVAQALGGSEFGLSPEDEELIALHEKAMLENPYEFLQKPDKGLKNLAEQIKEIEKLNGNLEQMKLGILAALQNSGIELLEKNHEEAFALVPGYLRDRAKIIDKLTEMSALEKLLGLEESESGKKTQHLLESYKTPFLEEPNEGEGLEKLRNKTVALSNNLTDSFEKINKLKKNKSEFEAALKIANVEIKEKDFHKVFPLSQEYLSHRKKMIIALEEMVKLEEITGVGKSILDKSSNRNLLEMYKKERLEEPYKFLEEINVEKIDEEAGVDALKQRVGSLKNNFEETLKEVNELKNTKEKFDKVLEGFGIKITGEQYKKAFLLTQKYLNDRKEMLVKAQKIADLEKDLGLAQNNPVPVIDEKDNYEFLAGIDTDDRECKNLQAKVDALDNDLAAMSRKLDRLTEQKRKQEAIARGEVFKKSVENPQIGPVQETSVRPSKPSGIRGWLLRVAQFFGFKQSASAQASQTPALSSHAVDPKLQARATAVFANHQELKPLPSAENAAVLNQAPQQAVVFSKPKPSTDEIETVQPDNAPSVVKKPGLRQS